MFNPIPINADHKDLVHDIAYDYHGKRIATCSSDQVIKIWDKDENGEWKCTASWRTHSGSVWRVTWAHPEFGQILATCSFDRTAVIWEEIVSDSGANRGQTHWVKRCSLVDSRTNVTDVKFAPRHLGLMIAACSQDGFVRIYEAPDIMNLQQWHIQHEISASKSRCSCISWNPSRSHPPMIAVGSDDANSIGAKINVFEYVEGQRKWIRIDSVVSSTDPVYDLSFAPNLGRSYHLLAVASKYVQILQLKPISGASDPNLPTKYEVRHLQQFNDHNTQVWRVCWNVTGTILASSGADGTVRLWKANYLGNWKCLNVLRSTESGIEQQMNSNA